MSSTKISFASTEVQERRKKYTQLSGKELAAALTPKCDAMPCIRSDEINLSETRHLKMDHGVVVDVSDPQVPRTVPENEVYFIGWM